MLWPLPSIITAQTTAAAASPPPTATNYGPVDLLVKVHLCCKFRPVLQQISSTDDQLTKSWRVSISIAANLNVWWEEVSVWNEGVGKAIGAKTEPVSLQVPWRCSTSQLLPRCRGADGLVDVSFEYMMSELHHLLSWQHRAGPRHLERKQCMTKSNTHKQQFHSHYVGQPGAPN